MTEYTYSVQADTLASAADPSALRAQINDDPAITIHCAAVTVAADVLTVTTLASLSTQEQTALADAVGSHDGAPLVSPEPYTEDGRPVIALGEAELGGSSLWQGSTFSAVAGEDTTHDHQITAASKLFAGTFWASPDAEIGDWIEFSVVDVDDLLGLGAGYVVAKYVATMYVAPGERRELRSGQSAAIPAGLYLRTVYHSTGQAAVPVLLDWLVVR